MENSFRIFVSRTGVDAARRQTRTEARLLLPAAPLALERVAEDVVLPQRVAVAERLELDALLPGDVDLGGGLRELVRRRRRRRRRRRVLELPLVEEGFPPRRRERRERVRARADGRRPALRAPVQLRRLLRRRARRAFLPSELFPLIHRLRPSRARRRDAAKADGARPQRRGADAEHEDGYGAMHGYGSGAAPTSTDAPRHASR